MKPTPLDLYREAQSLGLKVEADGTDLVVSPGSKCPADFARLLKAHKNELLAWLSGGDDYWRNRPKPDLDLPADFFTTFPPTTGPAVRRTKGGTEAQWLHVARQILAGEFDGADQSTRESLTIGLRSSTHPLCRQALHKLWPKGIPHHL